MGFPSSVLASLNARGLDGAAKTIAGSESTVFAQAMCNDGNEKKKKKKKRRIIKIIIIKMK